MFFKIECITEVDINNLKLEYDNQKQQDQIVIKNLKYQIQKLTLESQAHLLDIEEKDERIFNFEKLIDLNQTQANLVLQEQIKENITIASLFQAEQAKVNILNAQFDALNNLYTKERQNEQIIKLQNELENLKFIYKNLESKFQNITSEYKKIFQENYPNKLRSIEFQRNNLANKVKEIESVMISLNDAISKQNDEKIELTDRLNEVIISKNLIEDEKRRLEIDLENAKLSKNKMTDAEYKNDSRYLNLKMEITKEIQDRILKDKILELSEKDKKNKELKDEIHLLKTQLFLEKENKNQHNYQQLQEKVQQKDAEILNLKSEISNKDNQINILKINNILDQDQKNESNLSLDTLKKEIRDLRYDIEQLKNENEKLKSELDQAKKQIEDDDNS